MTKRGRGPENIPWLVDDKTKSPVTTTQKDCTTKPNFDFSDDVFRDQKYAWNVEVLAVY